MPSILSVIHSNSQFPAFFEFAKAMKTVRPEHLHIFVFHWYPTVARDLAECETAGMIAVMRDRAIPTNPRPIQCPPQWDELFGRLEGQIPPTARDEVRQLRERFLQQLSGIAALFEAIPPLLHRWCTSLLLLPAENPAYDSSVWVRAAQKQGIKAVVIPSFVFSVEEQALFVSCFEKYSCANLLNELAATLFPHWSMEYEGAKVVRVLPHEILAKEALGVGAPNPWFPQSGFADRLLLESEGMYSYARRQGIAPDRLSITGSVCHDVMFAVAEHVKDQREKLVEKYRLDPALPTILTPLLPDMFYALQGRRNCEFETYGELIAYWLKTLRGDGKCNVLVSLHPSDDPKLFAYIEEWGVRIVEERIFHAIPLVDLFVASVSNTIQWAIACGVPVVNYDVYRCRYTDFAGEPGVLTMETRSDFEAALSALVPRGELFRELQSKQRSRAAYWGRLDGKASARLIAGVEAMMRPQLWALSPRGAH